MQDSFCIILRTISSVSEAEWIILTLPIVIRQKLEPSGGFFFFFWFVLDVIGWDEFLLGALCKELENDYDRHGVKMTKLVLINYIPVAAPHYPISIPHNQNYSNI